MGPTTNQAGNQLKRLTHRLPTQRKQDKFLDKIRKKMETNQQQMKNEGVWLPEFQAIQAEWLKNEVKAFMKEHHVTS